MKKILMIFVALAAFVATTSAQEVKDSIALSGRVTDSLSGKGLPFAKINVRQGCYVYWTTVTDIGTYSCALNVISPAKSKSVSIVYSLVVFMVICFCLFPLSIIFGSRFDVPIASVPHHPFGRQVVHRLVCVVGQTVRKRPTHGLPFLY